MSFSDAKKKLRLALCSADSVVFPIMPTLTRNGLPDHADPEGTSNILFKHVMQYLEVEVSFGIVHEQHKQKTYVTKNAYIMLHFCALFTLHVLIL